MSLITAALALLAATPFALAQTSTDCNPLNETCPPNPALGTTYFEEYNKSMVEFNPDFYNVSTGAELMKFDNEGAHLTLDRQGQSVRIKTGFNIFFGRVECVFQAAKGKGIISTMNLISDDLDEIDWEVISGEGVSTNYYGWGNTDQLNGFDPEIDFDPSADMHNYTIIWTEEKLDFVLDDEVVRSVPAGEPGEWPQTPSHINLSLWSGGDPDLPEDTNKWAGGLTDWSQGPFTMVVKSLKVVDGSTNSSWYTYGDDSGSFESIEVRDGDSTYYKRLHEKSTTEKAEEKWDGLSTGAKIGIACGVVGAFLVALGVFLWYCLKQRKQGKAEREKFDTEWSNQNAELDDYKAMMGKGQFAVSSVQQPGVGVRGSGKF